MLNSVQLDAHRRGDCEQRRYVAVSSMPPPALKTEMCIYWSDRMHVNSLAEMSLGVQVCPVMSPSQKLRGKYHLVGTNENTASQWQLSMLKMFLVNGT